MSTSHYSSRPFRGLQGPPNTRKNTCWRRASILLLLAVDAAVLLNSKDLLESCILVVLVLVNIWALNTRP